jgi:hypothetical protein
MSQARLVDADALELPSKPGSELGLSPFFVPTSNRWRRQLGAHPSAALISRVQIFGESVPKPGPVY